ncbi:MAG TPA: 6,7-dimethyl-8-ribityllumazine synthase [Thermoanaerobaculia bacterium]|nr:6,7-dimethyl-8-ribityllumazine synthase [Thermoanaerobaculia bacterium]
MPRVFEGGIDASGMRFAIVASRFHEEIVTRLLEAAVECLLRHGAADHDISVYRVPGAFEIPAAAAKLASGKSFDALVTIGCLIRGETPHFDFIASQTTVQISEVAMASGVPVSFGVITVETPEQARQRSMKGNNKGWEAALAAIEMASLSRVAAAGGSSSPGVS